MKKINLSRLQPKFAALVRRYMYDHKLTQEQLGQIVDIAQPNIAAILSDAPQSRPLSAYYLLKFIRKGIVKVNEIFDNQPQDDREVEFWSMAEETENFALLAKIARLRRQGHDIDSILDAHLNNNNHKKEG